MENNIQTILGNLGGMIENVADAFSNNQTRYFAVNTESQTEEEKKELDGVLNRQSQAGVVIREYETPLALGLVESSLCMSRLSSQQLNTTTSLEEHLEQLPEGITVTKF